MQKHIYQNRMCKKHWCATGFGAVQKTHIQKHRLCSFVLSTGFGAVQRAYTKAPVVVLWGNYEVRSYTNTAYTKTDAKNEQIAKLVRSCTKKHIPKLLDVSIYHKYRFRAVQIRIYHIPKRTDNAHMKERFGTVKKTHIPKRLYADKLCLERFGAVQKTRIPKLMLLYALYTIWFGAVQKTRIPKLQR